MDEIKTIYEIKLTNNETSSNGKECLDSGSLETGWINYLCINDLKKDSYAVKSYVPNEVVDISIFQICN